MQFKIKNLQQQTIGLEVNKLFNLEILSVLLQTFVLRKILNSQIQ